jgi:tetratricopeptide (TPR) repeat protein
LELSVQWCVRSIVRDPYDARAYALLCEVQMLRDFGDEAIVSLLFGALNVALKRGNETPFDEALMCRAQQCARPAVFSSADDLRAKFGSAQAVLAQAKALQADDKKKYALAKLVYYSVLRLNPADTMSQVKSGELLSLAGRPMEAALYLLAATLHSPALYDAHLMLGTALFDGADYVASARQYTSTLQLVASIAKRDGDEVRHADKLVNVRALLARPLYALGDAQTAFSLANGALRADMTHRRALLTHGRCRIDANDVDDGLNVLLRLFVDDQRDDDVRTAIADYCTSVEAPAFGALVKLVCETIGAEQRASVLGFLAIALRDSGAVACATRLLEMAVEHRPESPALALNLTHIYELEHRYGDAFAAMRALLERNEAALSVGPLSAGAVLRLIGGVDASSPTLAGAAVPADAALVDALAEHSASAIVTGAEPTCYAGHQLELLAILFTMVKVLFLCGNLDVARVLVRCVNPLRAGQQLHKTTMRNEQAYFGCVFDLLRASDDIAPAVAMQIDARIDDDNVVYVVGDSHTLPLSWRYADAPSYVSSPRVFVPMLVTGMKAWHLRPGCRFYPRINFARAVGAIPVGATVLFVFGEIDCREGFLVSIERGRYASLRHACSVTVAHYVNALLELARTRHFCIVVHPVVPVLDVTRDIVRQYNQVLGAAVRAHPKQLRWLDFADALLTDDKQSLRADYHLDGTHLHPNYVALVQQAIGKRE